MQRKTFPGVAKTIKGAVSVLYVLFIVFAMLEVILRFYNPFHYRIKGDRLLLPVNERLVIRNDINPRLQPEIIHSTNSLGFRGPEKPTHFDSVLSVVAVGGSTTECHFLSDSSAWPWRLGQYLQNDFYPVWVNNAGFDGHSTFGHEVLLNDYLVRLRPKVILFLTGLNDLENDQPTFHDKLNRRGAYNDFKHFIFTNSEALNLGLNLWRGMKAQRLNNTTNEMLDLRKGKTFVMTDQQIGARLETQGKYLAGYRARLTELADTCKRYGIVPVFITQPSLFGQGLDSLTGRDLGTFQLEDGLNGKGAWEILKLYNAAIKEVSVHEKVPVIDLAGLMPKNSFYFYDASHFTNEGSEKAAVLIARELEPILRRYFAAYSR